MFEKITTRINRKFFRHMASYDINLSELKKKQLQGAEYEINNNFVNIIKNKNIEIVLYCSSGYRSIKAYKKLKKLGYNKIYNLYGGLE